MSVTDDRAIENAIMLGELFPGVAPTPAASDDPDCDDDEIERRQTHEMVVRLNFDLYGGDEALDADELLFRLGLGGVCARRVEVIQPCQRVKREPALEPRS